MEPLTSQLRHGDDQTIECWDDDEDLQCFEDIHIRTTSTATSVTNSSIRRSGHRDSISSRRSARSDLDSNVGEDEDWQVQLHDDDDVLSEEAIASAKRAGIPLPANIPKSALIGGTIKRLGRRKPRRNPVDDWTDDVELPGPDTVLELKPVQETVPPESLRQLSSAATSPVKSSVSPFWEDDIPTRLQSALTSMDQFTDDLGHDFPDLDDVPTIKAVKSRSPEATRIAVESRPATVNREVENLESDFELPADDLPLRLSTRKIEAGAASSNPEEFDLDWSEGSIGVRFGGTKRYHRSNPSSIVSVVSPSASSCLTGESEDEGLDGLVIPEGPLDLESSLKKRQEANPPSNPQYSMLSQNEYESTSMDDFFSGLEIANGGDAFDLRKLTLNPNVKCKIGRPDSPARRSATSITFTNTAVSPKSRIPRRSSHDCHSTHLETVSESGAALPRFPNSQFRVRGHASHASISSLPPKPTSTSPTPSTPGRRRTATRLTKDLLSTDHVSAGEQLLRTKRSMPSMRNSQPSVSTSCLQSSQPRLDDSMCSSISNVRPKTPVERTIDDMKYSSRRTQKPFIPAGASEQQSHHVNVKSHRHSRRTNSDSSSETPSSRVPIFRHSRSKRHLSSSGNGNTEEARLETLITAPKQAITKPTRRRNFGDGSELESFDDLPTSSSAERKFIKHPTGRGVPKSLRGKFSQSQSLPSQMERPNTSPTPGTAPISQDFTPRFARDTNASRNAREQRIASMTFNLRNRESNPLGPLSSNWTTQNISRVPSNPMSVRNRKSKPVTSSGGKPFLIKPMGKGVQEPRSVNGMHYNPNTFRWDGNETYIHEFESAKSPRSPKPAPALITNVSAMQNVQVVGGMVFDPQRMCWLKLAPSQPVAKGMVAVQLEDDIFAGLDDMEEKSPGKLHCGRGPGSHNDLNHTGSGDDRSFGDSSDEWPMTEEFDVGPEFIRRQRAEEEKWRRKVDKWVNFDRTKAGDGWRWAIRDIVGFNSALGALGTRELRRT